MKFLAIVCLGVLGSAPVISTAQNADASATHRLLPSDRHPSLVLTPQGAERLAPSARSESQASLRFELESPGWSRAQSLALWWTTFLACGAMGSSCALTPPPPTPSIPPDNESWRRAACKTPDTCGWLWGPALYLPYPDPQKQP
jgi:hypothetical protein